MTPGVPNGTYITSAPVAAQSDFSSRLEAALSLFRETVADGGFADVINATTASYPYASNITVYV